MLPAEIQFDNAGALSGSDARLIWEVVANISPLPDILARYGLAQVDFAKKLRDPMFQAAYKEVRAAWASDLNVQQRIKLKAGLLLEDSLEDLMLIVKDQQMATQPKLDAIKQLGVLAQADGKNQKDGGGSGSRFTVKINIGGGEAPKTVTIDGHALPSPAESA